MAPLPLVVAGAAPEAATQPHLHPATKVGR
jgi:hypothetical protein